MTSSTHTIILDALKTEVRSHGLRSGEIILEVEEHKNDDLYDFKQLITAFFSRNNIKTSHPDYCISEISYEQATKSMKYGLGTKPNYTKIDTEFTSSDQNRIVYTFISLFDSPRYYSIDVKLYKDSLELGDFWEYGGSILIDKERIGILWTNDLYDKFC